MQFFGKIQHFHLGIYLANIDYNMKAVISVAIDSNLNIKFHPSHFDLKVLELNAKQVKLSLSKNSLSEMISPDMKCSIELIKEKKSVSGKIHKVTEANGNLIIECKV
jgi:hypothetical protein